MGLALNFSSGFKNNHNSIVKTFYNCEKTILIWGSYNIDSVNKKSAKHII